VKMKNKNLLIGAVVIVTLVVLIFIGFKLINKNSDIKLDTTSNYDIPAFDNIHKSRELSQEEISSGKFREVELAISGMTCPYCSKGVSTSLLQLDGIIKTNITLEKRGGTVIYDSSKLTKEEIVNSNIFEGLYKAKIIDDKSVS